MTASTIFCMFGSFGKEGDIPLQRHTRNISVNKHIVHKTIRNISGIPDRYKSAAKQFRLNEATFTKILDNDVVSLNTLLMKIKDAECKKIIVDTIESETVEKIAHSLERFNTVIKSKGCAVKSTSYLNTVNFNLESLESMPTQKDPSIGILVVAKHSNHTMRDASILNKRLYAMQHGYGFHVLDTGLNSTKRAPAWFKIPFILSYMHKYDYIWSIDLDTVILDYDIRLESIIDPRYDIIMGVDVFGLNSGSFLIKCSDWVVVFLMATWLKDAVPNVDIWWENASIKHLMDIPRVSNHLKKIEQTVFNSYEKDIKSLKGDDIPFVLHFAGDGRKWEKVTQYLNALEKARAT